ncbi:putative low affinity copper uptake protein 2 [Trichoplax sp. H2]|nr:putative low affinity copper uptake protein 2 [Trichoplax sp. H2]|eukprot:RDD45420.1 putative low affinity copper uptake protein 2 [Trichoplax sp. H2]
MYEGIKLLKEYYVLKRQRLQKSHRVHSYSPLVMNNTTRRRKRYCMNLPFTTIFMHLILQIMQITLAYFMMLVTMSYNVWLFISVVAGSSIGNVVFNEIKLKYFSFGGPGQSNMETGDHCF